MKKIIIIGGGGHAKVLISILRKLNSYNIVGYFALNDGGSIFDVSYLGNDDNLEKFYKENPECCAAFGVGVLKPDQKREKIFQKIRDIGFNFPAIISPDAIVNIGVQINDGTVVFDGAIINSGSVLGACAIINTNSVVEHDCVIGDYVHIAPGAVLCGGVSVGKNSMIGAGATVIQSIKIGANCMIGAGSTVTHDCMESGLYIGSPIKRMSF